MGTRFPDWLGIAAATAMTFGGIHSMLVLIHENNVWKRRERVDGSVDSFDTETIGVRLGSRTRAKVSYFYRYKGAAYRGMRVSSLDIPPVMWAADQKTLATHLDDVFRNKKSLPIYVDPYNPNDALLVRYPLSDYLWRSAFMFVFGGCLLAWEYWSGITPLSTSMIAGVMLGLVFYGYMIIWKRT